MSTLQLFVIVGYTCQCGYYFDAVIMERALYDYPCPRCFTPMSKARNNPRYQEVLYGENVSTTQLGSSAK